jgi:hypothetical protein
LQLPLPSQVLAAVCMPFVHDAGAHAVPEATCSQLPAPSHLPSLPHGGLAVHWPAGAAVPAVMLAHVPSAVPVSAIEQAWQVPVHGVSQQSWLPAGPTQLPLAHWVLAVHGWPTGFDWQMPLLQYPLAQSAPVMQFFVLGQGAQVAPPQSTSDSSASFTPSMQCGATHVPLPSQTTPPLSLHVVPLGALVTPQVCAVVSHVFVLHAVGCEGQSAGAKHATQVPLPSHRLPP